MKRETRLIENPPAAKAKLALRVLGRLDVEDKEIPWGGRVSIGSEPSNDLVIDDEFVSGHHATLEYSGDPIRLFLHDRASRNGTYANGARVLATEVERGPLAIRGEEPRHGSFERDRVSRERLDQRTVAMPRRAVAADAIVPMELEGGRELGGDVTDDEGAAVEFELHARVS